MAGGLSCWSCGEPNPAEANWCEACGESTIEPPDPCVSCGADGADVTDGYCGTCGHKQPDPRDHVIVDLGPVAAVSDKGKRHHRSEPGDQLDPQRDPGGHRPPGHVGGRRRT